MVNGILRNKLQWYINRNSYFFIQENALENIVCEMESILSRPQCVNNIVTKPRFTLCICWPRCDCHRVYPDGKLQPSQISSKQYPIGPNAGCLITLMLWTFIPFSLEVFRAAFNKIVNSYCIVQHAVMKFVCYKFRKALNGPIKFISCLTNRIVFRRLD